RSTGSPSSAYQWGCAPPTATGGPGSNVAMNTVSTRGTPSTTRRASMRHSCQASVPRSQYVVTNPSRSGIAASTKLVPQSRPAGSFGWITRYVTATSDGNTAALGPTMLAWAPPSITIFATSGSGSTFGGSDWMGTTAPLSDADAPPAGRTGPIWRSPETIASRSCSGRATSGSSEHAATARASTASLRSCMSHLHGECAYVRNIRACTDIATLTRKSK